MTYYSHNKYAKSSLEDIKISLNGASRGYGKAKKKFAGFIPHFSAPFNMEIAASMRELIENLTNFYRTLELTADAASIIYQHKVLSERLQALEKDHKTMINQSTNRLGPTGISIYSGLARRTEIFRVQLSNCRSWKLAKIYRFFAKNGEILKMGSWSIF